MTEDQEFLASRVEEAKRRSAEFQESLTPEVRAKAAALVASVPEMLAHLFCSPSNDHGRQTLYFATAEEHAEWSLTNPR